MIRTCLVSLTALALLAHTASADTAKLKSREFKLMLEPARFKDVEPGGAVKKFWEEQLKPLIAERLDPRNGGAPRHKKHFKAADERTIVFKDTDACVLRRNNYIFRERTTVGTGEREVTLKFRASDLSQAADASFKGTRPNATTKLEEDVAPLTVGEADQTRFAQPRSTHSQFSLSVTQDVNNNDNIGFLRDATALYSGLQERLAKAGVGPGALAAPLAPGKRFTERGFDGAEVDLGAVDSEFDLVLWYPDSNATRPELAELSFKYKIAEADAAVENRALRLFLALQELPREWTSPEHQTKTEAGLPTACTR